ncbi:unnamed protein product [Durusdinium trenchii]|uniref:RING-CH-type domain-containing protein n=1 Tax=Durusdinium trenchii TaxID=1381693 RepID=A0ABP0MJL6_9DINO
MEEMQEANPEMMTCRICLESDTSEGDELLAPCLCCGSAKYVHRSCLDQWRVSGFDPKTVTHCGTCKAKFKLQAPVDAKGAEREVWGEIVKYLAIRIGLFFTVVTALGFLTPWLLGAPDVQILSNVILNHLTVGTLSTFVLAGGWAVLQALWSLNLCGIHPHAWSFDGKDATFILLVIVAIIGAIYLLYQLCKGLWEIAQAGQNVASANLRFRNKEMRQRVVESDRAEFGLSESLGAQCQNDPKC